MKKKDFLTYYSSLSNVELFKIIQEKENYQSEAVETAREILASRNYSTDEMEIAKSEIDNILNKKKQRKEKIDKKINRLNELIDENFGIKEKTSNKLLNLFCFVFFAYNLFAGLFTIRELAGYFNSKLTGFAFGILLYILQLLIIYLLYKRSNWGWVIMNGVYIFLTLQAIISFIDFMNYSEIFSLRPNPYNMLIGIFVTVGILVFLNTKKISAQFKISKIARIETLVISAVISGLFIFLMRFS